MNNLVVGIIVMVLVALLLIDGIFSFNDCYCLDKPKTNCDKNIEYPCKLPQNNVCSKQTMINDD